jgi:hypothetical protein
MREYDERGSANSWAFINFKHLPKHQASQDTGRHTESKRRGVALFTTGRNGQTSLSSIDHVRVLYQVVSDAKFLRREQINGLSGRRRETV